MAKAKKSQAREALQPALVERSGDSAGRQWAMAAAALLAALAVAALAARAGLAGADDALAARAINARAPDDADGTCEAGAGACPPRGAAAPPGAALKPGRPGAVPFALGVRDGCPLVANGNVWPPPPGERPEACLLLLSHSRVLVHCPDGGATRVLYESRHARFRGAFAAPADGGASGGAAGDSRRLWLLATPAGQGPFGPGSRGEDELQELDTVTGRILQVVPLADTADAHDAVRVNGSVFIADTGHGNVVEVAVPAASPPDAAARQTVGGPARVLRVYGAAALTRPDHVNNLAVHDAAIVVSLHGGRSRKSRTVALSRTHGGLLEGFRAVDTVGSQVHGIALWEDFSAGEGVVKLISLDSRSGSLVSVAVAGSGAAARQREVLWAPRSDHPAVHGRRGRAFAKGLAVQAGVAYFGVSPIGRNLEDRLQVDPVWLVAVDLAARRELWARPIPSRGLVNQILTEGYLGVAPRWLETLEARAAADAPGRTAPTPAATTSAAPVTALGSCLDRLTGRTKRMPLRLKTESFGSSGMGDPSLPPVSAEDMGNTELRICRLECPRLRAQLEALDPAAWESSSALAKTNAFPPDKLAANVDKLKPGVRTIFLIYGDHPAVGAWHFPWLDEWLPALRAEVFDPLGISLDTIRRMSFALMRQGGEIKPHHDKGQWVARTHRVHIVLTSNRNVSFWFIARRDRAPFTIQAKEGDVFEVNNAMKHWVTNAGESSRVHLVIDYAEAPNLFTERMRPGEKMESKSVFSVTERALKSFGSAS